MKIHFYKYQGAGNDFIIIDEMNSAFKLNHTDIRKMCDRHFGIGADGLMIVRPSDDYDFRMIYYNSDGYEGSMCGNGGRCVHLFAHHRGLAGVESQFEAARNVYKGWIEEDEQYLDMHEVQIPSLKGDPVIDTGSPHVVVPVEYLENYDVIREGSRIREDEMYKPDGVNVNFISEISETEICQRTYERGVENETLACGTGAVAGAVYQATRHDLPDTVITVHMRGGDINVHLIRSGDFFNVWLEGPAAFVFEGDIVL
ncbi:MAG: diaminopimelate epimerase [Bacteroidota bacterium]|nr:diaminopimelate epimerase [Bacteroidota bacterium]